MKNVRRLQNAPCTARRARASSSALASRGTPSGTCSNPAASSSSSPTTTTRASSVLSSSSPVSSPSSPASCSNRSEPIRSNIRSILLTLLSSPLARRGGLVFSDRGEERGEARARGRVHADDDDRGDHRVVEVILRGRRRARRRGGGGGGGFRSRGRDESGGGRARSIGSIGSIDAARGETFETRGAPRGLPRT